MPVPVSRPAQLPAASSAQVVLLGPGSSQHVQVSQLLVGVRQAQRLLLGLVVRYDVAGQRLQGGLQPRDGKLDV